MRVFGWHPDLMWDELSFQFANVCTLIKNDWLALLNITPQTVQPWPQQPTTHIAPDWDKELANARELNKNASRARPRCGWTKRFTKRTVNRNSGMTRRSCLRKSPRSVKPSSC
jgi:hypothetical protein